VSLNPSLEKLLQPRLTKYIPHKPTAKQSAFLLLDSYLDAFYGGAAGGGKSDALLMAALQYVDFPNYNALLIRDTYTNLAMPEALMDRADEWLYHTDASWNSENKQWRFPSGATVSFGYLDGPRDHLKYKGAEFQFIGIDEASDLRWEQVLYLFSRLRRTRKKTVGDDNLISLVPLRFRAASNPGGLSHEKLKERYIDPETKDIKKIFIPAGLDDNPYLDVESYHESLNELDPVIREQLKNGNWDIRNKGRLFDRAWFEIVETAPVAVNTIRYWDLASTEPHKKNPDPDWTTGLRLSMDVSGTYYIEEVRRFQHTPKNVEQNVLQTAQLDGIAVPIHMEQEPGSSGVNTIDHYLRYILNGYAFYGDKKTGSKYDRARPVSAQAEAGNIKVVRGAWNKKFFNELELFPEGIHDDQVDALSGAFDKLALGAMPGIRILKRKNQEKHTYKEVK